MRTTIAAALGTPEAKVRVIHPAIGGGFGVKTHIYPEDVEVAYDDDGTIRAVRCTATLDLGSGGVDCWGGGRDGA